MGIVSIKWEVIFRKSIKTPSGSQKSTRSSRSRIATRVLSKPSRVIASTLHRTPHPFHAVLSCESVAGSPTGAHCVVMTIATASDAGLTPLYPYCSGKGVPLILCTGAGGPRSTRPGSKGLGIHDRDHEVAS